MKGEASHEHAAALPALRKVVMEVHPNLARDDGHTRMLAALAEAGLELREQVTLDHPLGNYLGRWERGD